MGQSSDHKLIIYQLLPRLFGNTKQLNKTNGSIEENGVGKFNAIKDYYDVDPDLAVDVSNRMGEYEALINRSHQNGLKVLMDLVPNHVARTYASDVKPANVRDFGQDDDKSKAFDSKNDFYYTPGKSFVVPPGYNPGGDRFKSPLKDGK